MRRKELRQATVSDSQGQESEDEVERRCSVSRYATSRVLRDAAGAVRGDVGDYSIIQSINGDIATIACICGWARRLLASTVG